VRVLQLTSRAKMGKAKKPAVRLSAEVLKAATTDTRPLSAKAQIRETVKQVRAATTRSMTSGIKLAVRLPPR
jgi:hypothetical protein